MSTNTANSWRIWSVNLGCNGTQGIFHDRDDGLTVSIHCNPSGFFPFYWGHAQERWKGRGYNYNLALPMGTGNEVFMDELPPALQRFRGLGADVIVVTLGLDTHEFGPFQTFKITTEGFAAIGSVIASVGLSVLHVQEGGYLEPEQAENQTSYLSGADRRR